MTAVAFDELGEAGRARRLRPLALEALRAWRLPVQRLRLVTNGYNAVFRVDTDRGRYALRVNLPSRTDAELRAELDWLADLDAAGIDVPVPVRTATGERWEVAEVLGVPGSRRCVLFHWIGGHDLGPGDPPATFERFGAAAAALHEHASGWRRPRGLLRVRSPFPHPEEPPILFEQSLTPRVRATYERSVEATETALARSTEPPIVVHHDLRTANVRVHGTRPWIVDFDDCLVATPAQDLGVTSFDMRSRRLAASLVRAFRRGYEAVRPWPDDALVAAFTAATALELANAVYQDFDPGYRREAARFAERWARVAEAALRDTPSATT